MRYRRPAAIFVLWLAAVCAASAFPGIDNQTRSEFPSIKKDKLGRTWAARQWQANGNEYLSVGRLTTGGVFEEWAAFATSGEILSPDLDIDAESKPWLIWVEYSSGEYSGGEYSSGEYRVRAAGSGVSDSQVINGPYTASALSPSICAGVHGEVWAFWTGRDNGRDEIFSSLYRNDNWSAPYKLDADDRFPHIRPAAAIDGNGRPRAVWSAYDGEDYRIYSAAWNGVRWLPEEKISAGQASGLVPAITFLDGVIPVIVWNRVSGGMSELRARVKLGPAWNSEVRLIQDMGGPVHDLALESSGDRFVATWDSCEGAVSRSFSLFDCLVRTNGPPKSDTRNARVLAAPAARDENQYVGFGDSITYADGDGYVPKLETLLAQRYGTARVWNGGAGGEITAVGLARIDSVIAATSSKYLLLLEGTNDIIDTHISADTTAFNLQEMTARAQSAGMTPLLSTITPRNDSYGNTPFFLNKINDLNARIRVVTTSLSISLVDMYQIFIDYPAGAGGWTSLLIADGLHPNDAGFTVMAQTWFFSLKSLKKPKPPLSPALDTRLDTSGSRKINAVSWQANPDNAIGLVANYRIYRKLTSQLDSTFALFASVAPATLRYEDANLDIPMKYAYRVTAVSAAGDESDPTATVPETQEFSFPPLNLALASRLDATETRKVNALSWQANPNNVQAALKNYSVFRKLAAQADNAFAFLATVGPTTLSYEDTNLDIPTKYAYRVTALTQSNLESAPTAAVVETATFVFPPAGVALTTALDKVLFYEEKYNTIAYERNPLNDDASLAGYLLYRKRTGEDDATFMLIANLSSSTFRYTDGRLQSKQKYAYALTAVTKDGKESKKSAVVTEK
jgi:lysophospholipase L1-like esterase/fibronectin type 3 domain-containing protein